MAGRGARAHPYPCSGRRASGVGVRSAWPPAEPSGRGPSASRPRPPRSQAPPPPAPGRAGPGSHFGQSFVMVLGPQEAAGEAWPVSAAPTSVPRASRRLRPPLRRARRRLPAFHSPITGPAASERPGMGLPPGRDPSGGGGGGSGAAAGGSSALRTCRPRGPGPSAAAGGAALPGGSGPRGWGGGGRGRAPRLLFPVSAESLPSSTPLRWRRAVSVRGAGAEAGVKSPGPRRASARRRRERELETKVGESGRGPIRRRSAVVGRLGGGEEIGGDTRARPGGRRPEPPGAARPRAAPGAAPCGAVVAAGGDGRAAGSAPGSGPPLRALSFGSRGNFGAAVRATESFSAARGERPLPKSFRPWRNFLKTSAANRLG